MPCEDQKSLLESWIIALKAENKSWQTIKNYRIGATQFLNYATEFSQSEVQRWIAHLLEQGAEPKTAATRLGAVKAFSRWLATEGEMPTDVAAAVKRPKLATKVVEALSDDQLKALIDACKGKEFVDRRDEALVRFMVETGCRIGEAVALQVADVNLSQSVAVIRKGKGFKGRLVPVGAKTAAAVDRYIRARRAHRHAGSESLWLGGDNKPPIGYDGAYGLLVKRANQAGIENFHPHVLRNTAATRWLRAGGSEGDLMAICGWSERSMLDRYVAASASDRALVSAKRLDLGNL